MLRLHRQLQRYRLTFVLDASDTRYKVTSNIAATKAMMAKLHISLTGPNFRYKPQMSSVALYLYVFYICLWEHIIRVIDLHSTLKHVQADQWHRGTDGPCLHLNWLMIPAVPIPKTQVYTACFNYYSQQFFTNSKKLPHSTEHCKIKLIMHPISMVLFLVIKVALKNKTK